MHRILLLLSLTIYEMPHSPYCIPIKRALDAFAIPHERVPVPNWDRGKIMALTDGAYYQVPVLAHDEALIYETSDSSLDVAHYVDEQFASGQLFPSTTTGINEILIEHIENEIEGLTFRLCDIHYVPLIDDVVARTSVIRHKERRFGRDCLEGWKTRAPEIRADLYRLLGRFDATLQSRGCILQDNAPTYVDYALLGVIENLTYGGHETLAPDHTALRAWQERLTAYRF
ncbi:glutathione S-transferase family protein [Verrucomicrobiales bacterium]|nr:glutathione S-transferase family protein [Verrucomicrobiales bacterium]